MKTNEELKALKEEVETVSKKPRALTKDELAQVAGGGNNTDWEDTFITCPRCKIPYGAHAIKSLKDNSYSDVYCESCGFYASVL